jgi:hypothetical protein
MRKIKKKNNINNNKYVWEVEFREGKSREKYRSKVSKSKDPAQGPIARSKRFKDSSFHTFSPTLNKGNA